MQNPTSQTTGTQPLLRSWTRAAFRTYPHRELKPSVDPAPAPMVEALRRAWIVREARGADAAAIERTLRRWRRQAQIAITDRAIRIVTNHVVATQRA